MYMRKLRASDWLKTSAFFSCNTSAKFSKTTNCTCTTGSCNFVVFEKFTHAFLTPNCARNNKKNSSTISLPAVTS